MSQLSVALIGAASALAGVATSGAFTLLKGRQERLDKQADRTEQRLLMHRTDRRDIYAQFLSKYHEVDRRFHEVRKSRPCADPHEPINDDDAQNGLEASIISLREAATAVCLEGPAAVSDQAEELVDLCSSLDLVFAELTVEHAGATDPLWSLPSPERDQVATQVEQAHRAFVARARKVLGGDAPGFAQ